MEFYYVNCNSRIKNPTYGFATSKLDVDAALVVLTLIFCILHAGCGASGPPNSSEGGPVAVSSKQLFEDFQADATSATEKYNGKTLLVTGNVTGWAKGIVFLDDQKVWCVHYGMGGPVPKGIDHDTFQIKGVCEGWTDKLADSFYVRIRDCEFEKQIP